MPHSRRAWARETKLQLGPTTARLLLIAFGLALGLGAAELALRWGGPRWLGYRMRELTAGTAETFGTDAGFPLELRNDIVIGYRPGSRFPVTHYEYMTRAAIDGRGGRMTAAAGAPCDRVVPFLGDSVTFGVGVEDHETFVSLLRARSTSIPGWRGSTRPRISIRCFGDRFSCSTRGSRCCRSTTLGGVFPSCFPCSFSSRETRSM